MISSEEIIKELQEGLDSFSLSPKIQNVGKVEKNNDGVIVASGLSQVGMGELVVFEDKTEGFVLNLDEDYVSIILLGKGDNIKEGETVKRTGRLLSINVSEDLLERVINP